MASPEELAATVRRLGREISEAFPDGVLLVAVIRGSVPFLADLARSIMVPLTVDFLAISRYRPGGGRVHITKDLDTDIAGLDVVVVEDLVDTGLTLDYVMRQLSTREPRSLAACALLDRRRRRLLPVEVRFVGMEVEDDLLLGYGLEHGGVYPNVPGLVSVQLRDLQVDLHCHVSALLHEPGRSLMWPGQG